MHLDGYIHASLGVAIYCSYGPAVLLAAFTLYVTYMRFCLLRSCDPDTVLLPALYGIGLLSPLSFRRLYWTAVSNVYRVKLESNSHPTGRKDLFIFRHGRLLKPRIWPSSIDTLGTCP
jgi:hypothetical protein